MIAYEQIIVETHERIATITLNRPEKLNAWTPIMEREVADAVAIALSATDVRAILFTGAGRGFCAGADLSSSSGGAPAGPDRFNYLWRANKPLVAAINGAAAGVGLSLALYCDIRFMAADAIVTTAFSQRGLIAEHGSAWLLPRLVGLQNALDLLLSGRKVSSTEASAMGFARVLSDTNFAAESRRMAAEMFAKSSPRSLRVIKDQIRAGLTQTFDEALVLAHREQLESLASADFQEGVAAFRERRPSVW